MQTRYGLQKTWRYFYDTQKLCLSWHHEIYIIYIIRNMLWYLYISVCYKYQYKYKSNNELSILHTNSPSIGLCRKKMKSLRYWAFLWWFSWSWRWRRKQNHDISNIFKHIWTGDLFVQRFSSYLKIDKSSEFYSIINTTFKWAEQIVCKMFGLQINSHKLEIEIYNVE